MGIFKREQMADPLVFRDECGCSVTVNLTRHASKLVKSKTSFKIDIHRCPMHENAAKTLAALTNQLGAQDKIFTYLNSYAKNDHLKEWPGLSLEGLIAQVYGDLAAHNAELREAVKQAKPKG